MEPALLSIQNLSLRYESRKGRLQALSDVSLDIHKGQSIGIVGESGCGKSTLAHAIATLLPPVAKISKGKILYKQQPMDSVHILGKKLGMIFQDPMTSLNPNINIEKQMCEGMIFHQKISKAEAIQKAIHWLGKVQIPQPESVMKKFPHECSGGMSQRIMIAMTLSLEPEILIADEPTTALDVSSQAKILDILYMAQKERQMAMLFVSHDLGVISKVCKNIVVMYAGSIVESGETEAILKNPQHPYTQSLLLARPPLKGTLPKTLYSLEGRPPQLTAPPTRCSFLSRCPKAMDICTSKQVPMSTSSQGKLLCHLPQQHQS